MKIWGDKRKRHSPRGEAQQRRHYQQLRLLLLTFQVEKEALGRCGLQFRLHPFCQLRWERTQIVFSESICRWKPLDDQQRTQFNAKNCRHRPPPHHMPNPHPYHTAHATESDNSASPFSIRRAPSSRPQQHVIKVIRPAACARKSEWPGACQLTDLLTLTTSATRRSAHPVARLHCPFPPSIIPSRCPNAAAPRPCQPSRDSQKAASLSLRHHRSLLPFAPKWRQNDPPRQVADVNRQRRRSLPCRWLVIPRR